MTWLQILQLALTLLTQALAAFARGEKKEAPAQVRLAPEHEGCVQALAQQTPGP